MCDQFLNRKLKSFLLYIKKTCLKSTYLILSSSSFFIIAFVENILLMTSTVIVIFVLNTKYKQMNIIIKEGNT